MRPSQNFAHLQAPASKRLARLRKTAVDACALFPGLSAKIEIAHVTIELLNTWTNFVRSYFLSCILKPRRMRGGIVTATKFAGTAFNDAITVVMARHKKFTKPPASGVWPRRDEPAWHDRHVLMTSCDDLGCSNIDHIRAALSMPTRVFEHLPQFRNFYGHRNEKTAGTARAIAPFYAIPSFRHPTDILTRPPSGRPSALLVDWIDDVAGVVDFLCE
jgi:hypothetical protein